MCEGCTTGKSLLLICVCVCAPAPAPSHWQTHSRRPDRHVARGTPQVTRPILGISFAPDQSSEALGIKGKEPHSRSVKHGATPCLALSGLPFLNSNTIRRHPLMPRVRAAG